MSCCGRCEGRATYGRAGDVSALCAGPARIPSVLNKNLFWLRAGSPRGAIMVPPPFRRTRGMLIISRGGLDPGTRPCGRRAPWRRLSRRLRHVPPPLASLRGTNALSLTTSTEPPCIYPRQVPAEALAAAARDLESQPEETARLPQTFVHTTSGQGPRDKHVPPRCRPCSVLASGPRRGCRQTVRDDDGARKRAQRRSSERHRHGGRRRPLQSSCPYMTGAAATI
jgi:hypothetical protein